MKERTTTYKTLAIDLAKHVFQVAAENAAGEIVFESRLKSREQFHAFLRDIEPGVEVLMETGPGAQGWARDLQSRGISVRILPAARVGEHRSGAKNDRKDCHAILRAGRDASIQAVPIKSTEMLSMQALHRVRSGYLRRRKAIGSQIRGLLLEQGIAVAKGDHALGTRLARLLEDATVPIPDLLRELVAELWAEWGQLNARIKGLTAQLETIADRTPMAQRMMSIPGVGAITAAALICKDVRPERFANARQFAAYFGLVPEQHSSGARIRLGRMTKRGDGYVRSLAIQGAHAVLKQLRAERDDSDSRRLRRWKQRHGTKGAAVRLANRNLRVIWALLKRETRYQCRETRAPGGGNA